jgi:ABC-type Fe3+ transport system permease subunit
MDFVKGGPSGVEMAVLAALLLVCAMVAWRLYQRFSGRDVSDVQGLRLTRRTHGPRL